MVEQPPPDAPDGPIKRSAKKLVYAYWKRRKAVPPHAWLSSKKGAGESVFTQASAWEKLGQLEAPIHMVVTDQRIVWTYEDEPDSVILDMAYEDVVAFRGSERQGRLALEARERSYDDRAAGQTTIAVFRFRHPYLAAAIVQYVAQHIPIAARNQLPSV